VTAQEFYSKLSHSGTYALKYLAKFHHESFGDLYLTNNNQAVTHDGHTYLPANFTYTRPQIIGGSLQGGELQVSLIGNTLPELFQLGDYLMTVDMVGVLLENGDVAPWRMFHHQYGTMSVNSSMDLIINFSNDDRPTMVFPPNVFDAENNPGNS